MPPNDPKNPTPISNEELLRALVESNKQLAEAVKQKSPLEAAGLTPAQIAQIVEPPSPQAYRIVRCKSEETGATFDAHVVASKSLPHGRITQLLNYKHPEGLYTFQRNGGRVPDEHPILRDATAAPGEGRELQKHQLAPLYLQWRYENFWKVDLRRYVGRELHPHLCADPMGIKTPWQESAIGALIEGA